MIVRSEAREGIGVGESVSMRVPGFETRTAAVATATPPKGPEIAASRNRRFETDPGLDFFAFSHRSAY